MRDLIIEGLRIVAPLSVALIVFAEALGISPRGVVAFFRDRPAVMLRSLVAALILVPAVALALILVLDPAPAVAIGLAILVACPPAPLMIKAATKKGGDPAFIASLHLSLAALAVGTVPAVLHVLAIPLGFSAGVDPVSLLSILAKTILLPIGLGLVARALLPAWADRFAAPLGKVGSIGLLVVVIALAGVLYRALLDMDAWSYGVIAAVAVAALGVGHLMIGPQYSEKRTVLAVECAVRHPGLAIAIGTTNFTAQETLPVLVPCIITFMIIANGYLFLRRPKRVTAENSPGT
ncbi:MAG TPA: bile acid:sodium symporter [Gammaproteobacteria bacterium]|nr:bile acid:sodium symporter [Gammaproteobacteria bacterium]